MTARGYETKIAGHGKEQAAALVSYLLGAEHKNNAIAEVRCDVRYIIVTVALVTVIWRNKIR